MTPTWREPAKRLARESYPSFTTSVITNFTDDTLNAVARKVQDEIKHISSEKANTILKSNKENKGQKLNFSWNTVHCDLQKHMPVTVDLLNRIIPKTSQFKPLVCVITAMILKAHNHKLCLIQKVLSIFLYGNGVHKQICIKYLEPLLSMHNVSHNC